MGLRGLLNGEKKWRKKKREKKRFSVVGVVWGGGRAWIALKDIMFCVCDNPPQDVTVYITLHNNIHN